MESGRGFEAALIERAVFADEPAVRDLLDASDEERRRPVSRGSMFRSMGVALLEFLPIIAAGVVVIPARTASDLTVPTLVAGALAIVAAASRPVLWRQLASGRAEPSGSQLSINAISVLFAAFAIMIVALRSDDAGASGLTIGAFAVQGIASTVTVAAIVRAGRRAGGSPTPRTGVEALRAAVGALPAARQQRAQEDIDAALRVAVDGGILSEADAATLTRAPLGGLARADWALSQARRR